VYGVWTEKPAAPPDTPRARGTIVRVGIADFGR